MVTICKPQRRMVHRVQDFNYQALLHNLAQLGPLARQDLLDKLELEECRARMLGKPYDKSALEYLKGRIS